MSNNLMDTEPGGESRQYEGNLGYIDPHNKLAGQLGGTLLDPLHYLYKPPLNSIQMLTL